MTIFDAETPKVIRDYYTTRPGLDPVRVAEDAPLILQTFKPSVGWEFTTRGDRPVATTKTIRGLYRSGVTAINVDVAGAAADFRMGELLR